GRADQGKQQFNTTGLFRKYGSGTTTFENTGPNLFEEGIELYGGILSYNNGGQLTVGSGKALTFKDNATLRADATAELNTDIVVENGKTGTFNAGSSISMLVNETISGSGTLKKTGDGTVQLNKSSTAFTGTASVDEGILRAVNNISFGSATSALNATRQGDDFGTIAGAGTFTGNTITVNGKISPDTFVDKAGETQSGNEIGTLTLQATTIRLDGFTMDYDTALPNNADSNPATTQNDLLSLSSTDMVTVADGTINFRGAFTSGNYLIIDSNTSIDTGGSSIDGIDDPNGALKATNNGVAVSNTTPRSTSQFELRDYNGVADSQIWYTIQRNTLTMDRTVGGKFSDSNFTSLQVEPPTGGSGAPAKSFEHGDAVFLTNDGAAYTIEVDMIDPAKNAAVVSHFEAGGSGDITLTGKGILATTNYAGIEGKFLGGGTGSPTIPVDGIFVKRGSGTFTFDNEANTFEEGIELYGGTLSFNNGNQLIVGNGKALTFKEGSTLRADASTNLNTNIVIEAGKTASFDVGAGYAMLLQNTVSGGGSLTKTGKGVLQLGKSSTIGGTATINEGAFRVVAGKTFEAEHLEVLEGASLQGGGMIFTTGNTTTVKGTISPDSSASVDVAEADKFGTLTINGNTILGGFAFLDDGFTFEYDLGTALATLGGSTPTGDLLKVLAGLGSVELRGGLIALHGTLDTGNYLIIDSDSVINIGTAVLDGFNDAAGILTASLNGNPLTNTTPRNELMFKFGNGGKQVWLESEVNTLFMNWKAGSKDWGGADSWTSTQTTLSGGEEGVFRNGDFVSFADASGSSTANLLSDVIVSGLDTNTNQTVLFTGTGGIRAKKSDPSIMIGEFFKTDGSANPANQEFNTTGLFRKYGSGTTSFENTGGNLFEEGIELYQGTTGFNRADQLAVGNGKYLTFKGNAMLRPTASLGYDMNIGIDDNVTGTFDTAEGVVFDYSGTMTGSGSSQLTKTGGGTMNLNADSTGFEGAIDLAGGTLGINSNYGKSKSFVVHSGATLTGSGILGATASGGVIENGGTLAPRGYTAGNALATHLTVDGDLTFAAGSNFDVTISQNPNDIDAEGKMAPVSDYVKVQNGSVAIDSGANLNVTIDYWNGALTIGDFNEAQSGKFTVIDASDASGVNANEEFVLNLSELLPRGVKLAQGWQNYADGWLNFGAGSLYQLWFEIDPIGGFADLCPRHNRNQIGQNLDQLALAADPSMKDLIMQLSNPDLTRPELCNSLDYLTGDIVFNSLTLALKKPWRHPFGQLDRWGTGLLPCRDYGNCFACGEEDLCELEHKTRIWAEGFGRYTDVDSDGNALAFTIKRPGFAMGVDRKITDHTLLGATFNYSKPQLEQRTGKTEADDFEFGIYGRTELGCGFEAKAYAGFSLQRYDIKRRVFLSGKNRYADLHENYKNKTDGRALAASIDISRPIDMDCGWWLRPILALDYEQVWMDGYRERGGLAALKYDDSGMRRIALRAGLQPEYIGRENLSFVARIQYERELNPSTGDLGKVRFANAQIAGQRGASIRGVDWGDDCINLGIGMDWKFTDDRNISLQIDYDADFYDNAQTHSGMIGISWAW
ncbi:autotransporter domain-containing protein, partial [Desulfococcaceae bacterium OttesenSCG-928-F15]|nr:autotransporter domain-containing protein [Desulfococcaceae bacterium OttesenSCG-928-F15]